LTRRLGTVFISNWTLLTGTFVTVWTGIIVTEWIWTFGTVFVMDWTLVTTFRTSEMITVLNIRYLEKSIERTAGTKEWGIKEDRPFRAKWEGETKAGEPVWK
jgi:hypothetical protein